MLSTADCREHSLLDTLDHTEAIRILDDEHANLTALGQQSKHAQAAAALGHSYLEYLHSTWMPESLWQGWSQKGRVVAAMRLKIPIEGVLPTTNHLESFNGLLKWKYIRRWQHSGARLRFDFLIHTLVTKILPEIFSLRRSHHQYTSWLTNRFRHSTGGLDLNAKRSTYSVPACTPSQSKCLYWYQVDGRRDNEAIIIVNTGRIYNIQIANPPDSVTATCAASSASLQDPNHLRYMMSMHCAGIAHCECADFANRGGACKHLRALRFVVNAWAEKNHISSFYHPPTLHDAEQVKKSRTNIQATETSSSASHAQSSSGVPTVPTQQTVVLLNNLLALKQVASHESESMSEVDGGSEPSSVNSEVDNEESDSDTDNSHDDSTINVRVCMPFVCASANDTRYATSYRNSYQRDGMLLAIKSNFALNIRHQVCYLVSMASPIFYQTLPNSLITLSSQNFKMS